MKPSEMTNEELADFMLDISTHSGAREAAKRLRAMPEPPKPEFGVGWSGLCKCDTAIIYGIDHETGLLYGRAGEEACCWRSDGSAGTNGTGFDLIPNTPEPEIWYRAKGAGHMYWHKADAEFCKPCDVIEKVEVRVIE